VPIRSISPFNGSTLSVYETWTSRKLRHTLDEVAVNWEAWRTLPLKQRCERIARLGGVLRADAAEIGALITRETGKLLREAHAEVETCASMCDHAAFSASRDLAPEELGDAVISYQPLGTLLLMTPAHSPLILVMRVAVQALLAGNAIVLRHASQVPQCALMIERLMAEALGADAPMRTLLLDRDLVEEVIAHPSTAMVSFTGSIPVGHSIAEMAGRHGRKVTLHMGSLDPFVVLEDADMDAAVEAALSSGFSNAGQRALAAKRFVVVESVADEFVTRLCKRVESDLVHGDPSDPATRYAPMVTHTARDALHQQVFASRGMGAVVVTGCMPGAGAGAFYQASILDRVSPGMPVYGEELFGPVVAVIRVADADAAVVTANDTRFAFGASVWSVDEKRARAVAQRLRCGVAFINKLPRVEFYLPFSGLGDSGFGSLLGRSGIREYVSPHVVL